MTVQRPVPSSTVELISRVQFLVNLYPHFDTDHDGSLYVGNWQVLLPVFGHCVRLQRPGRCCLFPRISWSGNDAVVSWSALLFPRQLVECIALYQGGEDGRGQGLGRDLDVAPLGCPLAITLSKINFNAEGKATRTF